MITTYVKQPSVLGLLNKLTRRAQRIEITKLQTKTVTIKNVYKNKQTIDVHTQALNRCLSRI